MDINSSFQIGALCFAHRLIQGPLAGYTCAPYRVSFSAFQQPAYCVSEMISAHDFLTRQPPRFVYRDPKEGYVAYQLSGYRPDIMAAAAVRLQDLGADLIDINCGCPKAKIRKKGSGSALLAAPERVAQIISAIKTHISLPLTVKMRLQDGEQDRLFAQTVEQAGADALIVHGRCWQDTYELPCNITRIAQIKSAVNIPVIANGDITDLQSLHAMVTATACDAYMISRAGTGRPWLYQALLSGVPPQWTFDQASGFFMEHLRGLAMLQNEHQAILQSKTLVRYYFRPWFAREQLSMYYSLNSFTAIAQYLQTLGAAEQCR